MVPSSSIITFELKISGLQEALVLAQEWATHTVSLVDPDYFLKTPSASKNAWLRRYYFHDISINCSKLEFKLATLEQIQDILEFTAPLQEGNRLLVHCHAGISRSTAVACGILCQHGLSPREALKQVILLRPTAFPNRYIISLFDQLLDLKGELIEAVDNINELWENY